MWSVKFILLPYLVVIDFNHFFIFRTNVCEAGIELVKRKIMDFKKFRYDFFIGFGFWTRMDTSGINESGHHVKGMKAEIGVVCIKSIYLLQERESFRFLSRKYPRSFSGDCSVIWRNFSSCLLEWNCWLSFLTSSE